ncbi:MAG: hypothetical protein HKO56_09110 [Bacteroidia bacterium]|nr:hypothetical protein [Bacteroidia bacterium]NNC86043.1 hypothetical protein [Bacteroidia bacterium]NNM16804.1 hypothetical protein [Bacteroidia bacterium]
MNLLKYSILGLFLSANLYALYNSTGPFAPEEIKNEIIGTWQIDLRPTPDSEAYYKNFLIEKVNGKEFSGEFYDTNFKNGFINTEWENIYIGFMTKDKSSTYFHTATINGNKIEGITFSPEREFTSRWTGKKL